MDEPLRIFQQFEVVLYSIHEKFVDMYIKHLNDG